MNEMIDDLELEIYQLKSKKRDLLDVYYHDVFNALSNDIVSSKSNIISDVREEEEEAAATTGVTTRNPIGRSISDGLDIDKVGLDTLDLKERDIDKNENEMKDVNTKRLGGNSHAHSSSSSSSSSIGNNRDSVIEIRVIKSSSPAFSNAYKSKDAIGREYCILSMPYRSRYNDVIERALTYWGYERLFSFSSNITGVNKPRIEISLISLNAIISPNGCLRDQATLSSKSIGTFLHPDIKISLDVSSSSLSSISTSKSKQNKLNPTLRPSQSITFSDPTFSEENDNNNNIDDGAMSPTASSIAAEKKNKTSNFIIPIPTHAAIVQDFLISLLLIICLLNILLSIRDISTIQLESVGVQRATIDELFVIPFTATEEVYNVTTSFYEVKSAVDIWTWVRGPLRRYLFDGVTSTENKYWLISGVNELLGSIRFRQLRVLENAGCDIRPGFSCFPIYQPMLANSLTFGAEYQNGFVWSSAIQLEQNGTGTFRGSIATYDPSGYVLDIPGPKIPKGTIPFSTAYNNLVAQLENNGWIDSSTSAVMISFNIYNGNLNTYLAVQYLFERSMSGAFVPSYQIDGMRGSICSADNCPEQYFFLVLGALLLLVILFQLIIEITKCTRARSLSTFSPWQVVDFLLIISIIVALSAMIAFFTQQDYYISRLWDASSRNNFLYLGSLIYNSQVSAAFACVAVLMCFLRFARHFLRTINGVVIGKLIILSTMEGLFILIVFSPVIIALSLFSSRLYGAQYVGFVDVELAIFEMLSMLRGYQGTVTKYSDFIGFPSWSLLYEYITRVFGVVVLGGIFSAILIFQYRVYFDINQILFRRMAMERYGAISDDFRITSTGGYSSRKEAEMLKGSIRGTAIGSQLLETVKIMFGLTGNLNDTKLFWTCFFCSSPLFNRPQTFSGVD